MLSRVLAAVVSATVVAATLISPSTASAAPVTAADLPELLRTSPAQSSPAYQRDRFEHWIDLDGDGCNTRYETLIAESTTPVSVEPGCRLVGGTWVSPYDGFMTTDVSEIQIDHVVALAEAWRSGAWAWTDDQRRAFANDLGVEYALTAASNTANQSKADRDPAAWLPTNDSYICEYVTSWALIKYRWSLSADAAEVDALRGVLTGDCGATPVTLPEVMIGSDSSQVDSPEPAPPTAFPDGVSRLSGSSRYETAVAVSRRYDAGAPIAFVAAGMNFPDALSAAAAAATLGGPLLLTPTDSLPESVRRELVRLQPKKIFIAGSASVVSSAVESSLKRIAPTKRLGGSDRYETGRRVVDASFLSASHAFIASGRGFADALAATGAAGAMRAPVILVDGAQASVPQATLDLLARKGVSSVTIAGSSSAVSVGIENQLRSRFTTGRFGGADRYGTAQLINDHHFGASAAKTAFMANGLNFPDALAGAALAGRVGAPLYLSQAACVPEVEHLSIKRLAPRATVALGGTAVVSDNAARNVGCLTASRPSVSGSAVVGRTLSASTGAWTPGTAFTYQWLANGSAICGATGSTLAVSSGMVGKRLSVRVTGSQAGYLPVTVTSAVTASVAYPGRTTPVDSWNCPAWAPIKGNQDSMIYHLPGGAYYARTNPEECFRTEAAANAAGYRRSQR